MNELDKSGVPVFYEIVEAGREADLEIGPILLKKVEYSPARAEELRSEADQWQITERVEYTETVLWRGREKNRGDYSVCHHSRSYVIKDGHFYGFVIDVKDETGYGMSWRVDQSLGLLCVDGQAFGRIQSRTSQCSTEVDRESVGTFCLERKPR